MDRQKTERQHNGEGAAADSACADFGENFVQATTERPTDVSPRPMEL